MKSIKQGVAAFLAVLLLMPTQPIMAANIGLQDSDAVKEKQLEKEELKKDSEKKISEAIDKKSLRTPNNAAKSANDEVKFNTGSNIVTVVSKEDWKNELGDAYFEEDGSYTINIPEENPCFPYEIQFTYKGKTTNQWFKNPDDSIVIGGHTFYISAYFDDTVITQMSLNVAGDIIVVYPERKEFTDGDGAVASSLLPLKEEYLWNIDLSGYTPAELTMVSIDKIFTGKVELKDTDKIMWAYGSFGDDYQISSKGSVVDLSRSTSKYYYGENFGAESYWQIIVGEDDQLAEENIRYIVSLNVTNSSKWLTPVIYKQDDEGRRTEIQILDEKDTNYYSRYDDSDGYDQEFDSLNRTMRVYVSGEELEKGETAYIGLKANTSVFQESKFTGVKFYQGIYKDSEKAEAEGTDITEQIFTKDMTQTDAGWQFQKDMPWITMVTYNSEGKVTGCLPFRIYLSSVGNYISTILYDKPDDKPEDYYWTMVTDRSSSVVDNNGCRIRTYTLEEGYTANREYYAVFDYSKAGIENSLYVTAAYVGQYSTIQQAIKAGAKDIKSSLFNNDYKHGGYKADFSNGVYFTIFVGQDGVEEQEVYQYCIKTEGWTPSLDSGTAVSFYGLQDNSGNRVECYVAASREDSYAEYNYLTILVDKDVDLKQLAPMFETMKGLSLYVNNSNSPEVSGQSIHDFSKGPVQYTASSEDKENQRNYWLQIVKETEGAGKLYINSLADKEADSQEKDKVIYSKREILLDGYHDNIHDILLMNIGTSPIDNLSIEIESETVELDRYWTLNGNRALEGFNAINELGGLSPVDGIAHYGELPNMAKIRIKPKGNTKDKTNVSGKLTIKSGDTALMVLTLTGIMGNPTITTEEVPNAVKYVPYGTMIQNNNKYSWNKVTYEVADGMLPTGMEVKPNGELYGIPTETGEFTFTVEMENSYREFAGSEKTFTLTVIENTDENVDAATDQGYDLTQRIPNITSNTIGDQILVSEGIYDEFVDVFLDGKKLKEGEDYTSESGSTRITIKSQTLKDSGKTGTRTLGIEFRTKDSNTLKRAAQNYVVTVNSAVRKSNRGSKSSQTTTTNAKIDNTMAGGTQITQDSKKGYIHSLTGIITGQSKGYSHWIQEETGWKLAYTDGTLAKGSMQQLENGTMVEQILWEKINGSWYAFGADGFLKDGWVYDYQLNSWYCTSIENGMKDGWYTDPQDRYTYYLEPETGKLANGWKQIDSHWYYFNTNTSLRTWELDETTGKWNYNTMVRVKPYGAMYKNENTPDGYYVNNDGVWNEKTK